MDEPRPRAQARQAGRSAEALPSASRGKIHLPSQSWTGTGSGTSVTFDHLTADLGAIDIEELDRATLAQLRREAARRRNMLDELLADLDHALVMATPTLTTRPSGAVRIQDALPVLGMTYSYAVRHWIDLGGYKDVDGRLKIRADLLARAPAPSQPS